MDSTDYDSQADLFATQVPVKKKHFQTSSAPVLPVAKVLDYVYDWFIIFKWGGDIDFPFEEVNITEINNSDYDPAWLTGILSPKSRKRYRNFDIYPDFSVSVFAKVEKREFFKIFFFSPTLPVKNTCR